jgi:hypothetical protein
MVCYTTGRGFLEYTEAQVAKQVPEINLNIFRNFALDEIVLKQADGNAITIKRMKEDVTHG